MAEELAHYGLRSELAMKLAQEFEDDEDVGAWDIMEANESKRSCP